MDLGMKSVTLVERKLETGQRIALGRRSDEDARVFDPGTGEICEPAIQAATIVDPSWVPGYVIAGHQAGPKERSVAIYRDDRMVERCAITDGAWLSAVVALELGQTLRFDWSNADGVIIDSVTMPPLDPDTLESPRWHSYGPVIDT